MTTEPDHVPIFVPDDEYRRIRQQMPIPCVDLLVLKPSCDILLVRRTNEPARGCWWLPGGRVGFGETRLEAANRKLREECSLEAARVSELGTFDLLLGLEDGGRSHAITTVFRMDVDARADVLLDDQGSAAVWRAKEGWLNQDLHPFVQRCLAFA